MSCLCCSVHHSAMIDLGLISLLSTTPTEWFIYLSTQKTKCDSDFYLQQVKILHLDVKAKMSNFEFLYLRI